MTDQEQRFRRMQAERMQRYLQLREELGDQGAREALLDGYPERQRARMGPLITDVPLVDGFAKAQPRFAEMGVRQEIIDVSTAETDSVMEINLTCMCANACADAAMTDRVSLLCELDFEATRRAFPDLSVHALRRIVDGGHACVFRYSRPRAR